MVDVTGSHRLYAHLHVDSNQTSCWIEYFEQIRYIGESKQSVKERSSNERDHLLK